jgi:hypothetical protein
MGQGDSMSNDWNTLTEDEIGQLAISAAREAYEMIEENGTQDMAERAANSVNDVICDVLLEMDDAENPILRLAEIMTQFIVTIEVNNEIKAQLRKDVAPGDILIVSEDDPIYKEVAKENTHD